MRFARRERKGDKEMPRRRKGERERESECWDDKTIKKELKDQRDETVAAGGSGNGEK